jgi:alpha-1,3-glucan synthase
MLSQLAKTIKMALKSTEEERAILRARSALQRFPVVEWRQRTEDFHKRSIGISRGEAGSNAWRESDCDGGGVSPMTHPDDWNPVSQAQPSQPDWDSRSMRSVDPRYSAAPPPGSPGQWSQETLTTGDFQQPPRITHDRESTYSSTGSDDYFRSHHSAPGTPITPGTPGTPVVAYNDFLERANRTIAKDQRHAPDPFLEAPSRPFGSHSRVSSVESISSIVDEKSNSPLNKAIASVGLATFSIFSRTDVLS